MWRSFSALPEAPNAPCKSSTRPSCPGRSRSWRSSSRLQLPSRSALWRFFAALTQAPVEALPTLFLDDLLSRPFPTNATDATDKQTAALVDRAGKTWMVFEVDGTREAARHRALPQTEELPPPSGRLDEVCAPGYTGRKRAEIVRRRTVVSQAHRSHWRGRFGNPGNGHDPTAWRQALASITRSLTADHLPQERALRRLDGPDGTGAVRSDLCGFAFVTGGKESSVLHHPLVQARLPLPPDQLKPRPESQVVRSL